MEKNLKFKIKNKKNTNPLISNEFVFFFEKQNEALKKIIA